MERGLLWLPLLLFFIGFAWVGLREYQKVEAYQTWSKDFDKAKYDIYAVLGQKGRLLTWGKPHRGKPTDLVTFSLDDVQEICLSVDDQILESDSLPNKGKPSLLFRYVGEKPSIEVPFTDISLANKWLIYLRSL
jgi:hypothetical protein